MTDKTVFEKSHGGNMMRYTAGISPALQASLVPDAERLPSCLSKILSERAKGLDVEVK